MGEGVCRWRVPRRGTPRKMGSGCGRGPGDSVLRRERGSRGWGSGRGGPRKGGAAGRGRGAGGWGGAWAEGGARPGPRGRSQGGGRGRGAPQHGGSGGRGERGGGREARRWEALPAPPSPARGRAGPRREPGARRGRSGATLAAVDPGGRPVPTGSYLGLLLGHGCARRRGGDGELGSAGAGKSRSRPAALPPQMLAGPRFAPQIPERRLAGARSRGGRACTTRAPGASSARPRDRGSWRLGMRHGAGPRAIPAVPTPADAQGSGLGGARRDLGGAQGREGGGERGAPSTKGPRGAHTEPRPSGRARAGALPRGPAVTSGPWSTDLVPHLLSSASQVQARSLISCFPKKKENKTSLVNHLQ